MSPSRPPVSPDPLLAAIEAIHAAGIDAGQWPRALQAIADTCGGRAATFEVFDRQSGRHREFHAVGVPPAEEIAYFEHYIADNPRWQARPLERIGDIGWDYLFVDEDGMNRSAFYAELLAGLDLRYFLSGVLLATPQAFACVSVQFATRHGHVGQSEIGTMAKLLPHLRQAFDVAQRLKSANAQTRAFENAFDWMTDGAAIVTTAGVVTYANAALHAIARRGDAVRLRQGALEFLSTDAKSRFKAALGAVQRLRMGHAGPAEPIDFTITRTPDQPRYLVSVRPLADVPDGGSIGARGDVLVFVRDPMARSDASTATLRAALGLTAAECDVALALQNGVSLDHYARAKGVSINTVYTHLRRIREKTGCHSVAELAHKLEEFRIPLKPGV